MINSVYSVCSQAAPWHTVFLAAATRVADRLGRAVARSLERQRESRVNRQGMSPREDRRSEATEEE